jgi:hypothetical protein
VAARVRNAGIVFVQGLGMSALKVVHVLVFARTPTTLQNQNLRMSKMIGQQKIRIP